MKRGTTIHLRGKDASNFMKAVQAGVNSAGIITDPCVESYAYVALKLKLQRLEAERDALRAYCAALERQLECGRRALDGQGRSVKKARKKVYDIHAMDNAAYSLALQCNWIG